MNTSASDIVKKFDLQPHPEGGFYREVYRSQEDTRTARGKGQVSRSVCTFIYFLLRAGEKSHLHKILSDEIWHFYQGGPLEIIQISPGGKLNRIRLGQDMGAGESFHHVVPAGYWFGAEPVDNSEWALVGCTVSPGFDFEDFQLADKSELIKAFPDHSREISRLSLA